MAGNDDSPALLLRLIVLPNVATISTHSKVDVIITGYSLLISVLIHCDNLKYNELSAPFPSMVVIFRPVELAP
jgi:hypothetical protein